MLCTPRAHNLGRDWHIQAETQEPRSALSYAKDLDMGDVCLSVEGQSSGVIAVWFTADEGAETCDS